MAIYGSSDTAGQTYRSMGIQESSDTAGQTYHDMRIYGRLGNWPAYSHMTLDVTGRRMAMGAASVIDMATMVVKGDSFTT